MKHIFFFFSLLILYTNTSYSYPTPEFFDFAGEYADRQIKENTTSFCKKNSSKEMFDGCCMMDSFRFEYIFTTSRRDSRDRERAIGRYKYLTSVLDKAKSSCNSSHVNDCVHSYLYEEYEKYNCFTEKSY